MGGKAASVANAQFNIISSILLVHNPGTHLSIPQPRFRTNRDVTSTNNICPLNNMLGYQTHSRTSTIQLHITRTTPFQTGYFLQATTSTTKRRKKKKKSDQSMLSPNQVSFSEVFRLVPTSHLPPLLLILKPKSTTFLLPTIPIISEDKES